MTPSVYNDVESLVDTIIDRLGNEIVVGTPLGVGKANRIVNELVERAVVNPELELEIWTALSLTTPTASSDLESRLIEPLADRLFENYPDLAYDVRLQNGTLPENIEVHEFYLQPGGYMSNPVAQQNYHSVNYTHAVRRFENAEPNLLLQLIGEGEVDGELQYNIGTNTDISSDLIESLHAVRERGERDLLIVGERNQNMPFLYGDGPIDPEMFDAVLVDEPGEYPLFGPPSEPVSLVDYAIGLRVSTLIPDGGTLQIGIGSLGDAIGHALALRHRENETYRECLARLGVTDDAGETIDELGGVEPFETGLYGATELFAEAFLHLFEDGVLTREVYDDETIQMLVNEGYVDDGIDETTLEYLRETDSIPPELDADAVAFLQRWGLLTDAVSYTDGELQIEGETVSPRLDNEETWQRLCDQGLGDELTGGQVLDAAFLLGSPTLYAGLDDLSPADRRKLKMRSVQFTNALYGDEGLKRAQRANARFVNTGMKVTVTGGVVSDGIEDGRVVSGVGGQFNFVNQAQELDDGRSILMIRSTREVDGEVTSNVVWNYGHLTIPRHLRDIVVTEYGVADVRGKSDAEVIGSLICLADSRFQDELVAQAKRAGKLPESWEIPRQYQYNYPEQLEHRLGPAKEMGALPTFPYGSELTERERTLAQALRGLQSAVATRDRSTLTDTSALKTALAVPDGATPYLERMGLASPAGMKERVLQRVVVFALASNGLDFEEETA